MTHKSQKRFVLALLKQTAAPMKLTVLGDKVVDVPHRTLRRWLNVWVDEGIIKKIGQGRATHYSYVSQEFDAASELVIVDGLDDDLRTLLLKQLRDLWTFHSTAIEGNTLTLGDTHFVLEEGLTISGKPLKDHQEVIGHARAIELLYKSLKQPLSEALLFDLHKAVLTELVSDIYKPVGDWKIETNGSYAITEDGRQTFIEYALPTHVPELMSQLIDYINKVDLKKVNISNAYQCYAKVHMAFVHIHPFWDGNGRLARLIANIPLLKAGLPPIVVPVKERRRYIQTLANYQISVGQLNLNTTIWPDVSVLTTFEFFCNEIYSTTKELIEKVHLIQQKRKVTRVT